MYEKGTKIEINGRTGQIKGYVQHYKTKKIMYRVLINGQPCVNSYDNTWVVNAHEFIVKGDK